MDKKVLSVLAIVIIVAAAIGGAMAMTKKEAGSDAITIVDGAGKTISIDSPLTNVAVINSNVPKTLIMFGLSDYISCYYYGDNTYDIKCEELQQTQHDRKLGTYYTPSVETLVKYQVQAVLCPVSSMTLYSSVEKQCNEVGIKVIRLNCTGGTILDDMKKVSKLFGDQESSVAVLDKYQKSYNDTLNAIASALDSVGGKKYVFISSFTSKNAIYNHTSDMSALLEHLFLSNITAQTDLSTKGVTNPINDNTVEKITELKDSVNIGILRSVSATDSLESYKTIYDTMSATILPSSADASINNRIFVLNSDLMSGLYAHIGLLILVKEVYDISVPGYTDINKLVNDFQTEYKQSIIENGEILACQFGNSYTDGTNAIYYTAPA